MTKEREAKEKEAAEKLAKEREAKEKEAAEKLAKENEAKGKDDDGNKRPVATPQVASEARPALSRGSPSFDGVCDILNRQNSNITSPEPSTSPAPSSSAPSVTVPAATAPAPTVPVADGAVDVNGHKKKARTPAQLIVHKKKMSFYRSLDSTGLMRHRSHLKLCVQKLLHQHWLRKQCSCYEVINYVHFVCTL